MSLNTALRAAVPAAGSAPLLLLSAVLVVLDQVSKYLCDSLLTYASPHPVMPGLDLLLVYNRGAAFSFLSDAAGWQRWILSGVSLVVSIVVVLWLLRLPRRQKLLGFALALILGGAVGNLIDRVLLGYVIDFISVYAGDWRFATFNVADAAISVGAALMALDLFKNREA